LAHTDNTDGTSHARLNLETGGASGGDPLITLSVSSAVDWYVGVDNSDGDQLKIGSGSTTVGGGSNHFALTTSGILRLTGSAGYVEYSGAYGGTVYAESWHDNNLAHGMTDILPTTQFFGGSILDGGAPTGGALFLGLNQGTRVCALQFFGLVVTGTTAKSTAARAPVEFAGGKKSGTSATTVGANENLVVFKNWGTTRFILDGDGDSHQDVGTAWTNFDAHDDLALLALLSAHVTRPADPLRASFDTWLQQSRAPLEALGIVRFNPDGHHFINWSRTHMLIIGALRQLGARLAALETRA
jgi:hypothetical protein